MSKKQWLCCVFTQGIGTASLSYQTLQNQHIEELDRVNQENTAAINHLKETYENQISALREQISTIEKASEETAEEQRNEWTQKLISLQTENAELSQRLYSLVMNINVESK